LTITRFLYSGLVIAHLPTFNEYLTYLEDSKAMTRFHINVQSCKHLEGCEFKEKAGLLAAVDKGAFD